MDIPTVVLGWLGALFFLIMAYYTLRILQHFQDHKEIALSMFFLQEKSENAFKIHALGAAVVMIGLLGESLTYVYYNEPLLHASRLIMLPGILGFVYFYYMIFHVTKKPSDRSS